MYIRSKLQPRAIENIAAATNQFYPSSRVTKGFVVSNFLEKYENYILNEAILLEAITESDEKAEGPGIAINLNITADANQSLNALKLNLDKKTGRSLFPAQVIDILLICVLKASQVQDDEVSNNVIAKSLLDFSYRLLSCDDELSINEKTAKIEIYTILLKNNII